jgi:hypothetical protein
VLAGILAWSYRAELRRAIHRWTAADPAEAAAEGLGDPRRAPAVVARLATLRDSIVLSAAEVASLVAAAAAVRIPDGLDSIVVRLGTDEVELGATVDTRQVPIAPGPLGGLVRERERVELAGPVYFRRAGLAEWEVTRARVRGVPLPGELAERLLRRWRPGASRLIPLPLPAALGGLRIRPAGLVLYGTGAGGPR